MSEHQKNGKQEPGLVVNPVSEDARGSQKNSNTSSRFVNGLITVVVSAITLITWAVIRESKGTFWLFDKKILPKRAEYRKYIDSEGLFSVNLPSSLDVKRKTMTIPAEGGKIVELRIHTASSDSNDIAFAIGIYKWDIGHSPTTFLQERLHDVITGLGGTLDNSYSVERQGCTALRGTGKGTRNGQHFKIVTEICIKNNDVFALNVTSTNSNINFEEITSVQEFFKSFILLK